MAENKQLTDEERREQIRYVAGCGVELAFFIALIVGYWLIADLSFQLGVGVGLILLWIAHKIDKNNTNE